MKKKYVLTGVSVESIVKTAKLLGLLDEKTTADRLRDRINRKARSMTKETDIELIELFRLVANDPIVGKIWIGMHIFLDHRADKDLPGHIYLYFDYIVKFKDKIVERIERASQSEKQLDVEIVDSHAAITAVSFAFSPNRD